MLQRERKKRREGADAYRSAGRDEQADAEERELAVLEEFMPEPLAEDELEAIIDDVIAEVGATSLRHVGRVMADVMPQVSGRVDGSVVSQLVREKLAERCACALGGTIAASSESPNSAACVIRPRSGCARTTQRTQPDEASL